MNLFTYLLSKKGKNSLVHKGDLFAYLLGKQTPKEVKTATGTTISITDATKAKIVSLTLSKESMQDGTPTPENPVEVKTVKGNVEITITDGTNVRNYTIPLNNNEVVGIGDYKDELIVDKNGHCWLNKKAGKVVLNGSENWSLSNNQSFYLFRSNKFPLTGGSDIILPSLSNYYIVTSYSNINNKIVDYGYGFGSNERRIDIRNKDITNLNDFKNWLSTHNTEVYYVRATPQLIDLNYDVDVRLFNGVNNISNSDDMDMTLEYY